MKESGLRIRVETELREKFIEVCRSQDVTASQVLRHYMRQFVEAVEVDKQPSLFANVLTNKHE